MRRFLILAAALVLILLVAGFFARRSLMQGNLREAVEARLSATLGEPVSIGRLGIALFPRVALSGTGVRVGDARAQAPGVSIERIRILPRTGSLLSGNVVIEQVQLDGFVVSVLHDAAGWHLPSAVPAPSAGGDDGVAIERLRVSDARIRVFDRASGEIRERASIDDIHAEIALDGSGMRLSSIAGQIGDAEISGEARVGARAVRLDLTAAKIADEDLPAFLRLLGAERPAFLRIPEAAALSARLEVDRSSSRLSGTGKLAAPEVELDSLRLERFEAPFAIDGSRLAFDPATFGLYGGTHTGTVNIALAPSPPEWTADSRLSGVDAGGFLGALTGRDQQVDGSAAMTGVLRGQVGEALATGVQGRARIEMTEGVIRNFPLLAYVNRALRLAEQSGTDTRFERLTATLAIASGRATTDDLVLDAGHLRVEASGRIGVDRSLALRGVAAISPERSVAAIASIHELKGLRNARGEIEIPLTISGSLDSPSFALDLEAAIRKGIADELRRRLLRIIK